MGIFSGYTQGENRVTSTIMAVIQELTLSRINTIIGALLDDGDYQLGVFSDQPGRGHYGVLDASIVSNSNLLFEVKAKKNSVDRKQLERHLLSLGRGSSGGANYERLVVLTPDRSQPEVINGIVEEVGSNLICWSNFQTLHDVVDQMLVDGSEFVSEKESFLLRELQAMLHNERLLCYEEKDTLIVPARSAWDQYQKTNLYTCQPGRSFRQTKYIGFYAHGEIKPKLAKIMEVYDHVVLNLQAIEKTSLDEVWAPEKFEELKGAVKRLLETYPEIDGATTKLFLLDDAESPDNIDLKQPVKNDKRSGSGKVTAFTQNQTYTHSESLKQAEKTSELIDLDKTIRFKKAS